MVVEFSFKRVPAIRAATYSWRGPWKEARIRSEFEKVARWAKGRGLRAGRWLLVQPTWGKFQVAVEVRGSARGDRRIRVRTLPASRVASITFDPGQVSPEVVYHGLNDWLRWRKRERKIKAVGNFREVYRANPWKDAKAWASVEIQALVR